jgi:hypothetical protein
VGFGQFLRKEGMAYRLIPVVTKNAPANWMVDAMSRQILRMGTTIRDNNNDSSAIRKVEQFAFGGADRLGTYFDEENRRHLLNIRSAFAEAAGNAADNGQIAEAKRLLERCDKAMLQSNFPYALTSRYNMHNQVSLVYIEAAYKAGLTEMADKIAVEVKKDFQQQKAYYDYLRNNREKLFTMMESEPDINDVYMKILEEIQNRYKKPAIVPASEGGAKPIVNNPAAPAPAAVPKDTGKKP